MTEDTGQTTRTPLDLSEIAFDPEYDKGLVDISRTFYLPSMARAQRYDRIAGYFSSGVYILAWPCLPNFVGRAGRIRLVCSAALSAADVQAITEGEAALRDERLASTLIQQIRTMLASPNLRQPAAVLAGLIASGVVEVKVAALSERARASDKRKFHDKVGLFHDQVGNHVGFRGTMNETYLGLAADGNLESIDVFPSWVGDRDAARCASAARRFEQIWTGTAPEIAIRPIPEVALEIFEQEAHRAGWELILEELAVASRLQNQSPSASRLPPLRGHQEAAKRAWVANNNRGVLKHATGSGKTITGLAIADHISRERSTTVVVVPSSLLLAQWTGEIRGRFPGAQLLRCGDGSTSWRRGLLRKFLSTPWSEGASGRYVVATLQTATDPDFVRQLQGDGEWLLIADEVHRMGSASGRTFMDQISPNYRLGLSATPERAGDPEGTMALLEFFGGLIEPPYGLREALADGVLAHYNYSPHRITLSDDEQEDWERLTRKINRAVARLYSGSQQAAGSSLLSDPRLRQLLIDRAKIVKGASAKIPMAIRVLQDQFRLGDKWLVYCDDVDQMLFLRAQLEAVRVRSLIYHSSMIGDKSATLSEFDLNGGILLSIRCLDEGVDIPSATHGLILASSKNPREFIQRRGRLLRTSVGKGDAQIHDAIVTPSASADPQQQDKVLLGEMARAMEFAEFARNPQCITTLERICTAAGLDFRDFLTVGEEDDEDGY